MEPKEYLRQLIGESMEAKGKTLKQYESEIISISEQIANTLLFGRKILVAGNGSSAADAQHFTAELTGK